MITDMETFLLDFADDRVFRFWVYRRLFTPYEQQQAFIDETQFEDSHAQLGIIKEAIDLGNGDWLLGFQIVDDDGVSYGGIEYYKLSEIRLSYYEQDKYQQDEEGEMDEV